MDPPYFQKGSDLYMNYFKAEDHRQLRDVIKNINKRWMVSYDNNEFILNLYTEYRKVIYRLSQCASNRIGDEVLIFDNIHHFDESITKLSSPNIIR